MIHNLTMSKLAMKGDLVIGSFAVFSLILSSVVTFTLTSFFSTILPVMFLLNGKSNVALGQARVDLILLMDTEP